MQDISFCCCQIQLVRNILVYKQITQVITILFHVPAPTLIRKESAFHSVPLNEISGGTAALGHMFVIVSLIAAAV